jgi:predicted RNA-binding protein
VEELIKLMEEIKEELVKQTELLQKIQEFQTRKIEDIDIQKHLSQINTILQGTPFGSVLSKMTKEKE